MPLYLLDGEGSHRAHLAEELRVGAREVLQELGEHLVGLRGDGQPFSRGPGPAPGRRGGWAGRSGVT